MISKYAVLSPFRLPDVPGHQHQLPVGAGGGGAGGGGGVVQVRGVLSVVGAHGCCGRTDCGELPELG